jgi:DNA-binding transcriptional LysR family regulator
MELRHLRYFVAVAEELHFGRAAERLHIAQPPLSQQIRQLEAEVGVALFERTSRRVRLTEAGQVFLEEVRPLLDGVGRAAERARRAGRGEVGWLSVGFVASAGYGVLPDILRRFHERYPEVELSLIELHGGEQGAALRDGRIHVGFTRVPAAEEGIVQEVVVEEPLLAALPSAHRLATRLAVRLDDLAGEPFIQFPAQSSSGYAEYVLGVCRGAGFTPNVVQKTGELATAVSLVVAGIGVSLVPAPVQNLRREGVVYRPVTTDGHNSPTIGLTMMYRDADPSPVLPRFLAVTRETVGAGGPG